MKKIKIVFFKTLFAGILLFLLYVFINFWFPNLQYSITGRTYLSEAKKVRETVNLKKILKFADEKYKDTCDFSLHSHKYPQLTFNVGMDTYTIHESDIREAFDGFALMKFDCSKKLTKIYVREGLAGLGPDYHLERALDTTIAWKDTFNYEKIDEHWYVTSPKNP